MAVSRLPTGQAIALIVNAKNTVETPNHNGWCESSGLDCHRWLKAVTRLWLMVLPRLRKASSFCKTLPATGKSTTRSKCYTTSRRWTTKQADSAKAEQKLLHKLKGVDCMAQFFYPSPNFCMGDCIGIMLAGILTSPKCQLHNIQQLLHPRWQFLQPIQVHLLKLLKIQLPKSLNSKWMVWMVYVIFLQTVRVMVKHRLTQTSTRRWSRYRPSSSSK